MNKISAKKQFDYSRFPPVNAEYGCNYVDSTELTCGQFSIKPFVLDRDIDAVHDWVNQDYAVYWAMKGCTIDQVRDIYQKLCGQQAVYSGFYQGQLTFLIELYDPASDLVSQYYPHRDGDLGMHILLAPANRPLKNFSWTVFYTVMNFICQLPDVKRILVEPDTRNQKIHKLNRRAGFFYHQKLYFPHKAACLATVNAATFLSGNILNPLSSNQSNQTMNHSFITSIDIEHQPFLATSHLQPDLWSEVNRLLIRKAISEFAHECLITPKLIAEGDLCNQYYLQAPAQENAGQNEVIRYEFDARVMALNHWSVSAESISKFQNGQLVPLNAQHFIIEFHKQLSIATDKLPVYLEEISNTLNSSAYKRTRLGISARELVNADFQTIESAMLEGHPAFVANNGRVGFDAKDYRQYAPEVGQVFKPVWIAAHISKAHFASASYLNYRNLMEQELGEKIIEEFNKKIIQLGLKPDDYIFMPLHPWQWFNKISSVFSADIAQHNIICLGFADDEYQAQQSIRTLFNRSHPGKNYVKMSLSILNMGFMRGLSPYYMSGTPAINEWVGNLLSSDKYLQQNGFYMLREVASVGYSNSLYDRIPSRDTAYRKMLACLWRESPIKLLEQDERLMTMAALLYLDADGDALVKHLVQSSGLSVSAWVKSYLVAYLTPLIHCFYKHDLVFMPHGENIILVMRNYTPMRAIMKDIAEEIAIMNMDIQLPNLVDRVQVDVPEQMKVLSIFIDVFDGFFRYLAPLLEEHLGFSEQAFWKLVAEGFHEYQLEHPELNEKFARYDFFCDEFAHSCLNRLQLVNNLQMISDLMDQTQSLQFSGNLKNPIAAYKESSCKVIELDESCL
jgi:siderophore synthetase component